MTGAAVFIALSVAGGVGAALRFLLDGLIRDRVHVSYPIGTTFVNATGSLGLGILTGAAMQSALSHDAVLIIGGGLMGGYTTFSTASLETVRLAQDRRYTTAMVNGAGMLVVCVASAGLGLLLGGVL